VPHSHAAEPALALLLGRGMWTAYLVSMVERMATIGAVHLRGGPCDGERPEAAPGTTFPEDLDAITIMDHSAGVGHNYRVTDHRFIDVDGLHRTVFDFRRSVERRL